MVNLFIKIFRIIFAQLDKVVIFLITQLYKLLIMIANTNVFGDMIYHYLGRIYTFLGIFMLFKLSLSMLTYIVNPDQLTDQSKGAGKLISNVVISLILLVATPTIFSQAFRLQTDLLNTNAVYQIVTGKSSGRTTGDLEKKSEALGKQIAYGVFSSFIYKKDGKLDDSDTLNPEQCKDKKEDPYCLVDTDTVTDVGSNEYHLLISTICGGFVAYMLLMFCIDAGVRAIKLGFLQIIAPIPILSMIDPKSGNKKLMDWAKESGKTFADLFIRLAGLFFAIDIISVILDGGTEGVMTTYSSGASQNNIFVRLFIILGALTFAKQLPNLIESLFGIKLSGGGLSLKKRLGDVPGLGVAKAVGAGALGFAGGMAANSLANMKNHSWDKNKGFWKNVGNNAKTFGSGLLSATGGAFGGATQGMLSKEKNVFKAAGAGIKQSVDNRDVRDKRQEAGYGFVTRMGDKVRSFAGIDTVAKAKGIEIGNNIVDMRRQASQYDKLAESIAQNAGWDPTTIQTITNAAPGTYAVGTSEQRYLDYINKSTELSGQIIKQEKRQAIFQKEASKK